MLQHDDAEYFEAFWTKTGYIGHDSPELFAKDLINFKGRVTKVITATEFVESADYAGSEFDRARPMAMMMAGRTGDPLPFAIEVPGISQEGYRLGAGVKVTSGKAAGRSLYCMNFGGDTFICDGHGDANLLRFTDVEVGDEVHVDNRAFLAFCYYYRHHLPDDPLFDFLKVDGRPIYPQHLVPMQSPLMGVAYSGKYEGKLMWVHHTHDASLWPAQGLIYERAVNRAQGPEGAAKNFRLRWSDNAEHVPPTFLPSHPDRASSTWLIDYFPIIEQGLVDLCDWCEKGVAPAPTAYTFKDGKVTLPPTAAERGGIQPVLSVTANGAIRAEVRPGDAVTLQVQAEVPPKAGTIIAVEWDFDGSGAFPFKHEVNGKDTQVKLSTTHQYQKPGTYFATARVISHRQGDLAATSRRVENVASARIVVG
jgi:hypothetical protein